MLHARLDKLRCDGVEVAQQAAKESGYIYTVKEIAVT